MTLLTNLPHHRPITIAQLRNQFAKTSRQSATKYQLKLHPNARQKFQNLIKQAAIKVHEQSIRANPMDAQRQIATADKNIEKFVENLSEYAKHKNVKQIDLIIFDEYMSSVCPVWPIC